jgi:predicted GH43/DUF377 family glycosyl hydrolase
MADTRVVLCMIVRNEAAIISRCLDAALPHVDGYVVCDTGSTDRTIELVSQAAARFARPGRVIEHAWRDFGHNRTLSAREGRAWAQAQGWPLDLTYLLFLDADMIVRADGRLDRQSLTAPAYSIAQDDGTLRYYNTRLACLSREWEAVGVTHEYWRPAGNGVAPQRLEALWIQDAADGGSRSEKLERDIRLLTGALREDPGNLRHMFYLAQSFYDAGQMAGAADWYARRWAAGGWAEERWYARYREGLCLLQLGEHERGVGTLLAAFGERAARAEPLHALARHYREQSQHHLALLFARSGLDVPYPVNDTLFVSTGVYDWQLWEEIMIAAYYTGEAHHELGLSACERLLGRRGHPQEFYDYVARNEVFYLPPIEAVRRGTFAVSDVVRMQDGIEYACANPAAVRLGDRVHVNVRLVNYQQERGRSYTTLDPSGRIRTRNVTVEWNPRSDRIVSERESSSGIPADWDWDVRIQGLEDVRWIAHDDRVWFAATCCQVPGRGGQPQVVLGRMNAALDGVDHLVALGSDLARPVEKNWIPWSLGRRLFLIYSYDPFVVVRVDPPTGRTWPAAAQIPQKRAVRFRGSTPPVRIPAAPGRWVLLVHEVAHQEHENVYAHRFVEIDESPAIVGWSRPFVFDHRGIEYAAGLCSLDDERLLVTYGSQDREARWVEIEWKRVIDMIGHQAVSGA